MRVLVTGATGFVGGHVVDACLRKNWQVSALTRPGSDTAHLQSQGVTIYRGEPNETALLKRAVTDVDVVVNCAAKVGDWGPHEEYLQANVENLRLLLDACKGQGLSRFVHLSSLGVYPTRHHRQTEESMPLPARHRDGYSHSKVQAEKVVMQYYRDFGVPVVILRPGFVYGPRDKTVMPRIIDNLRRKMARYPGGGHGAVNTIFVGNLVDAILLAISVEGAVGQVYNLTDGEKVTKRQFMERVADAMDLPHPWRRPPLWLAWLVTWCCEAVAKARGAKEAPAFNFTRLKFMGYDLDFSIEKARRELGYRPRVNFNDAMVETMAWYKEEGKR
jgi:nucleoside-diphosphate-sugar epimerase